MNLEEQAQAGLASIEYPSEARRVQDTPVIGSNKRTTPLPVHTSKLESVAAGFSKSATWQMTQALLNPEPLYFPDDKDLTKNPELLEGIPEEKHHLILEQVSEGAAQAKREEILERQELTRLQYANGAVYGLGSELLGYFDPVGLAGGAMVNGVMKIPAMYRAGKTGARLWGAGSIGALTFTEETIRNQRAGVDTDDALYATAGAMVVGGAIGNMLMKGHLDDVDEILVHADESSRKLGAKVQEDLDNAKALHPERDTQPHTVSDEHYDVVGADIEITEEILAAGKANAHTQNFTEAEYQIAKRAEDLVTNGEVTNLKEMGSILEMIKRNPVMSDGVRAALSKSAVANVISAHIGEIATGTRGKIATTAAMHKNVLERQILMDINPAFKNAKVEFLSKRGTKWYKPAFYGKGHREFNEALKMELAARHAGKTGQAVDPVIAKLADKWDGATKRVLDELQKAGWRGAEDVKWKSGWFPLMWSGEAISKLKTLGKLGDGKIALTKAYTNMGMSEELSVRLVDAVVARGLNHGADLDFNPASLFTKQGLGDLERILDEAGVSAIDKRGALKILEADTANGMHARTEIDLTVSHNGVSVLDMIQSDMGDMMSRWAQRNAGMVGLAKKGIKDFDTVDSFKKLARTQAAAHGEDPIKLGHSVDAVFDTILAKPVYKGVSRNTRRVMDWSMATKLGQIVFAQTAEMSNISAAHGLFQSIKSIPEANKLYNQLRKAARTGDWSGIDKEFMGELQVWGGGMIDEHLLFRPSIHMDETADAGFMAAFDNVQAAAVEAMGTIGGMYRVKGMEQTLTLMLQSQKVAKLMKGKMTKKKGLRLSELGWGEETVARIQKQFNAHATYDKKVLDRLNLEHWDVDARAEFLAGMHRHVQNAIQLPMAGEGTYWMHQDVAAIMLQFRNFPMLAIEKQTGRHLMAQDPEAAAAFMYSAAWSSVASLAKTYTNAVGRSDRDEYLSRRMEPTALAMQAMNYGSSFSFLGDIVGLGGQAMGFEVSGYHGGVAPSLDGVYRFGKGIAGVASAANPMMDTDLTERDVRNLESGFWLSNTNVATVISNGVLKTFLSKEK